MLGVNRGFHDSPLPGFAVKNYSDPSTFKNSKKQDDYAIAQDLALRMGSQALSKLTIGGLTYAGIDAIQDEVLEPGTLSDHASMLVSAVPAIGAAWVGSHAANEKIPELHRKAVGNKSFYKVAK